MTACDDIVNSDKNIKSTKIDLGKVKEIQDRNVLMPLKVGNSWHYNVKEFDSAGALIDEYIDSIVVLEKIDFRSEKWFRVNMVNYGSTSLSILTNTDKGLYISDEYTDLNCTFMIAHYPSNKSPYITLMDENVVVMYFDGERDVVDTVTYQYFIELDNNYSATYKSANYPARKYSTYVRALELADSKTLYKVEVFVPNLGLFEHKNYRFAGGRRYVSTHYTLIATNLID